MNKNKIKAYAPVARKELLAAVAAKAQILGLSGLKVEPVEIKGDFAIIGGRPFPRLVAGLRRNLEVALKREGFGQLVERIAFTWFNRFTALRYMELHGFLDHGLRVLSHPKGGSIPEILEHATEVDLPGLDKAKATELRMAGNKDAELYRLLLISQCNALNSALPFLFERTNDETELLLPDNLLHSDSPIRKLVDEIDEADWNEVEIIGWLYQFYISEKKDSVIGKVVKSEDIPAATQLFTPNWIVKYLVQNTLGRQWLATYPQSSLRGKMEFYIEPAEQTDEVKGLLKNITPSELNPETITFFDPACGSGHILVEAYELFKQIYEERGYARRDIPRLILEKNLFGLDIDERAAQFASFALMMKARADDRGLFRAEPPVRPHVLAIQESNGLDFEETSHGLLKEKVVKLIEQESPVQGEFPGTHGKPQQPVLSVSEKPDLGKETIHAFLKVFENAKTFGSLIQVPDELARILPTLEKLLDPNIGRDLPGMVSTDTLRPLVQQARVLTKQFDHVVANPPYMGNKFLNPLLKEYLKKHFKDFEKDLFSTFIVKNLEFTKDTGSLGFMSPFVWMFISTYEKLRSRLIDKTTISSLIQLEYSGFDGATVPICTFILLKKHHPAFVGSYIRLADFRGAENQASRTLEAIKKTKCKWFFNTKPDDFKKIPGSPIAYWASDRIRQVFEMGTPLGKLAPVKHGITTGNNNRFFRYWQEVRLEKIGFFGQSTIETHETRKKWFPCNKGGEFRKWYGNNFFILNYCENGKEMRDAFENGLNPGFRHDNPHLYFLPSITWTDVSSSCFGVRNSPAGFIFDHTGNSVFPNKGEIAQFSGFLCSNFAFECMKILVTVHSPLVPVRRSV